MKVGTDGVLLGAWANVEGASRMLDVGAGSGLIAIMLAQRTNPGCEIEAVEIEDQAYQQAVDNIKACRWSNRIQLFHQSFQNFSESANSQYDLIVSNPPYFVNGLKNPEIARSKARHSDYLPFEELLDGAKQLLASRGKLAVVLPVGEGELFIRLARKSGFYLYRQVKVSPNPGKPAKRYLLEFKLESCETKEEEMAVENGQRHVYTPEYIELTKDFYLKF